MEFGSIICNPSISICPNENCSGFAGPSGSGKSSLAINTLFQEGQRRYLETFSVSERGIIEQPEKPDADEIEGLPPAIAVARSNERLNSRVTVGSTTEILHYLQLAFSRFGNLHCDHCDLTVKSDTVDSVLAAIDNIDTSSEREYILDGAKLLVCFEATAKRPITFSQMLTQLIATGYQRCIWKNQIRRLDELKDGDLKNDDFADQTFDTTYPNAAASNQDRAVLVIVDRLTYSADQSSIPTVKKPRFRESIEAAFFATNKNCVLFFEWKSKAAAEKNSDSSSISNKVIDIDGRPFIRKVFQHDLTCNGCGKQFVRLQPNELTYHSPVGACQECEGLGVTSAFFPHQIIPDSELSLSEGAVVPFGDGPLKKENARLLASFESDFDRPFRDLKKDVQLEITSQCIERLNEISKSESKKTVLTFLKRFRSDIACPSCNRLRFNPIALSHRLFDKNPRPARPTFDRSTYFMDSNHSN